DVTPETGRHSSAEVSLSKASEPILHTPQVSPNSSNSSTVDQDDATSPSSNVGESLGIKFQLIKLVKTFGAREILNMLPVSLTPRTSISLKRFIGLGYFARQTGRRTVFDYWRK